MSFLAELEQSIVNRLVLATPGGTPLFATVAGASGPYRPALRDAMSRALLPAAFVAFIEERPGGELVGFGGMPRFVVLLADRTLRIGVNPRTGGDGTRGAFTLLDETRERLDDYAVLGGLRLVWQMSRFVDADDRQGVYEIAYRVEPAPSASTFGGAALGGAESAFRLTAAAPRTEAAAFSFPGIDGEFRLLLGRRGREVLADGLLLGADAAALTALEDQLDGYVRDGRSRELLDGAGRTFRDCVLDTWRRCGPRMVDGPTGRIGQACRLTFVELSPI